MQSTWVYAESQAKLVFPADKQQTACVTVVISPASEVFSQLSEKSISLTELQYSLSFDGYVVLPGQPLSDKFRIKSVFPWIYGDRCLLHMRGFPPDISGTVDIVITASADTFIKQYRIEQALTLSSRWTDVAFLLDDSYSMRQNDSQNMRASAVKTFAEIASVQTGVSSVSIIAFARDARMLLPPTSPRNTTAITQALQLLKSRGSTDMDLAFSLVNKLFTKTSGTRKIVVLVSDGRDEPGYYMNRHLLLSGTQIPVFSIGLSEEADVETLKRISRETNGAFFFAPKADALATIFKEIAFSLHNKVKIDDIILDDKAPFQFPVDDTITLLCIAGGEIDTSIYFVTPQNERILFEPSSTDGVHKIHSPEHGTWRVIPEKNKGDLTITGLSNLELIPYPVPQSVTASESFAVASVLVYEDMPVTGANVVVRIKHNTHIQEAVLFDDGKHNDNKPSDGIYAGAITTPSIPENYNCEFIATGITSKGFTFRRKTECTISVVPRPHYIASLKPDSITVELESGEKKTIEQIVVCGEGEITVRSSSKPDAYVVVRCIQPKQSLVEDKEITIPLEIETAPECDPGQYNEQIEILVDKESKVVPVIVIVRHKPEPLVPIVSAELETPPEELAVEEEYVPAVTEEQKEPQEPVSLEPQTVEKPELKKLSIPSSRYIRHTSPLLRIALWIVLLVLLLTLFIRWLLLHRKKMPRMTKYILISATVHALAFLLTMNIVMETTKTPVERISPAFALSIRAVENMLGFEITPPATEIPINESATVPHIPKKEIQQSSVINKLDQPTITPLSEEISSKISKDTLAPSPAPVKTVMEKKLEQKELEELAYVETKQRERRTEKDFSKKVDIKREYLIKEEKPQVTKSPKPVTMHTQLPAVPLQSDSTPQLLRRAIAFKKTPEKLIDIDEKPSVSIIETVKKQSDEISRLKAEIDKPELLEKFHRLSIKSPETEPILIEMPEFDIKLTQEVSAHKTVLQKAFESVDKHEIERDVAPPVKMETQTTPPVSEPILTSTISPPPYEKKSEKTGAVSPKIYTTPKDISIRPTPVQLNLPEVIHHTQITKNSVIIDVSDENITPTNFVAPKFSGKDSEIQENQVWKVELARQTQPTDKIHQRISTPVEKLFSSSEFYSELKTEKNSLKADIISAVHTRKQLASPADTMISDTYKEKPKIETKQISEQSSSVSVSRLVETTDEENIPLYGLPAMITETSPVQTSLPEVVSPKSLVGLTQIEKTEAKQFNIQEVLLTENIQISHRFVQSGSESSEKQTPTKLPDMSVIERVGAESKAFLRLSEVKHTAEHLPLSYTEKKLSSTMLHSSLTSINKTSVTPTDFMEESVKIREKYTAISAAQADPRISVRIEKTPDVTRDKTITPTITKPKIDAHQIPLANTTTDIKPTPVDSHLYGADFSFITGTSKTAQITFNFGLAKHSGDWYCSGSAMMFLAHQLGNRTGLIIDTSEITVSLSDPDIMKLPFIYITGHKDFVFSDAEILNLRRYLENGGYLWIDDSTHYGDETFDTAVRREIARVLPNKKLEKLDRTFPAFKTGYDLTAGFKGYAIPPGDKYRVDYIEGIGIGKRIAVVYTRNDYGDGLCIDPYTHPLKVSLTDLSPAEMQESSLRMAINLVLYFISGDGKSSSATMQKVSSALKSWTSTNEVIPTGQMQVLDKLNTSEVWTPEQWGDSCSISVTDKKMEVKFEVGNKEKIAITRSFSPQIGISDNSILAVDVESHLHSVIKIALGLTIKGEYYETVPFYIKPGSNIAFFKMSATTFKTAESNWEYKSALKLPSSADKLTILLYSPFAGKVTLQNLRIMTIK